MEYEVKIDRERSGYSRRENDVLEPYVSGKTIDMVAEQLHISRRTVETHLLHIYQKTGVENIKQLMTYLFVEGIAKGKKLILCFLIVSSGSSALMPSEAYAQQPNDWRETPVEAPMNRLRVRGGGQVRTGKQMNLRTPSRKRED